MHKNDFINVLDDQLKANEDLEDPSTSLVKICRTLFCHKYRIDDFGFLGLEMDDKGDVQREWCKCLNLEDIDIPLFSQLFEQYLTKKNKEKTGSFYTPHHIVEYMVERSLIIYLWKKTGISKENLRNVFCKNDFVDEKNLDEILQLLDDIKIIDIACGTGLFLIECFEKLYRTKRRIYKILGKTFDAYEMKKSIIEKNLFGVDVQQNPIWILKMVLLSFVYDERDGLNEPIKLNMIAADSLIAHGVFQEGSFGQVLRDYNGFDMVLGNPPYLGEKGNKEMFSRIRKTDFGKKYYEGKMDYFYFFIYKSLEILKHEGVLSYITTNYFVTADGALHLREWIKNSCAFIDLINFNDFEIFKSAKGQHNIIFSLIKGVDQKQPIGVKYIKEKNVTKEEIHKALCNDQSIGKKISAYSLSNQDKLFSTNGHILVQENHEYEGILKKIIKKSQFELQEICNINQGIVSGADKITKSILENKISMGTVEELNILLNEGIFVLEEKEVTALEFWDSPYLKPMYKNSDIYRYWAKDIPSKYILYITDDIFEQNEMKDKVFNYLSRYKEILDKRRETVCGSRSWYALQWPRKQEIFENTKIIVPQRAKENRFALNNSLWYASADVYFITGKKTKVDWNRLLAQLNSKIMYFWLYNRGKRKGKALELYANPLKTCPILLEMKEQVGHELFKKVNEMIKGGENPASQEVVDKLLYGAYGLRHKEIQTIEDLYQRNFKK